MSIQVCHFATTRLGRQTAATSPFVVRGSVTDPCVQSLTPLAYWPPAIQTAIQWSMGERTEQRITERPRSARKRPKQTAEASARRLLEIVVYARCCRIGGTLTLDDLAETSEVGDWKMSQFKAACFYGRHRVG
jgi:hypothetical protein